MLRMGTDAFHQAVEEAFAAIPEGLRAELDNVVITVEDEPSAEDYSSVGLDPGEDLLFGLYQGTPLTERGAVWDGLPDRIVIYRRPLLEACDTRRQLLAEIRDTVVHEVGHYFGFGEEELP